MENCHIEEPDPYRDVNPEDVCPSCERIWERCTCDRDPRSYCDICGFDNCVCDVIEAADDPLSGEDWQDDDADPF